MKKERTDLQAAIYDALGDLTPLVLHIDDNSQDHIGHPGAKHGAGHYHLRIVATTFSQLSRIERHRIIYKRLKDLIPDSIHALSIDAKAPDEIAASDEK